jgi:hypothetical protein
MGIPCDFDVYCCKTGDNKPVEVVFADCLCLAVLQMPAAQRILDLVVCKNDIGFRLSILSNPPEDEKCEQVCCQRKVMANISPRSLNPCDKFLGVEYKLQRASIVPNPLKQEREIVERYQPPLPQTIKKVTTVVQLHISGCSLA